MNVNIPDDLIADLRQAYNDANLSSGCDGDDVGAYLGLLGVVEALFVYIPKPAPNPLDIPVQVMVIQPAPVKVRKPRTKHQREVYDDIVSMSRRRGPDGDHWVWVDDTHVGSKGACAKLVEKGWIEREHWFGPNGGQRYSYRPIVEVK